MPAVPTAVLREETRRLAEAGRTGSALLSRKVVLSGETKRGEEARGGLDRNEEPPPPETEEKDDATVAGSGRTRSSDDDRPIGDPEAGEGVSLRSMVCVLVLQRKDLTDWAVLLEADDEESVGSEWSDDSRSMKDPERRFASADRLSSLTPRPVTGDRSPARWSSKVEVVSSSSSPSEDTDEPNEYSVG